jgi:hypothetical protein
MNHGKTLPGEARPRWIALLECAGWRQLAFLLASMGVLVTPLSAQMPVPMDDGTRLPHPDIPPPIVPTEISWTWWILGTAMVMVVLLLALVLGLLFMRRPAQAKQPVPPLKVALLRLEELQREVESRAPSEIAHRVSVIVRDYLQARYAVPAPFRTTEELYGSSAIQAREGLRERFGPVAMFYDRIEFAPQPATQADSERLIEEAVRSLRDEKRYAPGAHSPSLPQSPPSLPFMPTKM